MSRYEVDSSETRYAPGSNGMVLENKLNISNPEEMGDIEAILLAKLYEKLFIKQVAPQSLNFEDIASWHRQWLGNIYPWAGAIRNVDMSKGGFQFTSPLQIAKCLSQLEQNYLANFQNIPDMRDEELVSYLAKSHVELILVHPFREGNGRISRLVMDMMCFKAGLGVLDYSLWDKHKKFYIASTQAGVGMEFKYMEELVRDTINQLRQGNNT